MTERQRRYGKEEFARRGTELYESKLRPLVETGNEGRIVAVDIESGAYELGDTSLSAAERLLAHHPDAQIWCVRIGHPAVHRFGRALTPCEMVY